MYLSIKMGAPAPFALLRWSIAERFHWTLAEVDQLTLADWHDLIQIDDGRAKARNGN